MISMVFREHQGLDNKTPDEVSDIKTECENKWITLIQNVCKKWQISIKSN